MFLCQLRERTTNWALRTSHIETNKRLCLSPLKPTFVKIHCKNARMQTSIRNFFLGLHFDNNQHNLYWHSSRHFALKPHAKVRLLHTCLLQFIINSYSLKTQKHNPSNRGVKGHISLRRRSEVRVSHNLPLKDQTGSVKSFDLV